MGHNCNSIPNNFCVVCSFGTHFKILTIHLGCICSERIKSSIQYIISLFIVLSPITLPALNHVQVANFDADTIHLLHCLSNPVLFHYRNTDGVQVFLLVLMEICIICLFLFTNKSLSGCCRKLEPSFLI